MLGKLKYYLKRNINIKSGYTLAIGIISIFLVVGGFSFAIFTATTEQKGVLNIVTGNLYSLLESDLLNTSNSISIPASSSKTFYIRIKNVNTIDAKFNLYYTKVEGVNIYYTATKETSPTTSGVVISAGAKREIEVVIDNTTTSSKTITFGSDVGLSNKPLTFPVGKEVIMERVKPAVDTLLEKVNPITVTDYNSGNKQEMFTFNHPAGVQQAGYTSDELIDYRYIGNTPNNYVTFNNEVWRIIGIFTVENESGIKEKRVKIVRDEPIGDYSWDSSESSVNSGWGINEWSQADLMKLLNPGHTGVGGSLYYNKQSGTCYSGFKNETKTCDFTTIGLSEGARGMIGDAKWWLGGSSTSSHSGPTYYAFERGNTVLTSPADGIARSNSWIGKIGLIYPSDYAYTYANGVDNKCYTDTYNCDRGAKTAGWLYNSKYQWLLSSNSSATYSTFFINQTGFVYDYNSGSAYATRPGLYLKHSIGIASGNGSSTSPYTLR